MQLVLRFTKLQLTCVDWWLLHLVEVLNWGFNIGATNINFHKRTLVFDKGLKGRPFRDPLFLYIFTISCASFVDIFFVIAVGVNRQR